MVTWVLSGEIEGDIQLEDALTMALLHDVAECVLGDLPQPANRYLPLYTKQMAESQIQADLLSYLPQANVARALLDQYETGETATALLVRDADRLDMLMQALTYEESGHRGLNEFWHTAAGHPWAFTASARLYQTLLKRREELR